MIAGYENENDVLVELGKRIKLHRIASGITQPELAYRSDISPSTETRIERGEDSKLSNYLKVLSALQMLDSLDSIVPAPDPEFRALYDQQRAKEKYRPGKSSSSKSTKQ